MNTIYPVLLAVPDSAKNLKGREKVIFLSRYARKALKISAEHKHIETITLIKDDNGRPLPFQGIFWSVTHKSSFVGGIVSTERVGIDIEKIKPCSAGLFEKTARDSEWGLADDPASSHWFFRFWTAKEAVLKATSVGISGLLTCKVVQILDESHLVCEFQNRLWIIEHYFFDDHIASVVKNHFDIRWITPFHPISGLHGKNRLDTNKDE